MTGLQLEIGNRRDGKRYVREQTISYSSIARIINKSYQTAKNKVIKNSFTVEESIKIFETLFKALPSTKYEAYKYLFTQQKE